MSSVEPSSPSVAAAAASRRIEDLPGPRGWPVVGNSLQLRSRALHLQLEAWSREHGPYYRMRIGPRVMLVSADPQANAAILKDRPGGWRRTRRIESLSREMGFAGLFSVNGDDWRRQRPMVMAAFDPAHTRAYFESLNKVTERLHARWAASVQRGDALELQPELMRYTVDVTAGLAFGVDINTIDSVGDDRVQKHLEDIFETLQRRLFAPVPYWHWVRLPRDRKVGRDLAEVRRAVAGFIAQARERLAAEPERREHPANLMDAMVAARDRPASHLTDVDVAGNVLTMLLAGEDTTANTLSWMIWLLHRHPGELERARAEADAAWPAGTQPAEAADLDRLPFIQACAEEAMRLKPVAPAIMVEANQATRVGDVEVPADTLVCLLTRPGAIDPRHFEDPEAFRPARWLAREAAGLSSSKRVSMPFGAGPRMCPGRYLALMEMKMLMAMLLRRFDIVDVTTSSGGEAEERMAFTMAPEPLALRLRRRD